MSTVSTAVLLALHALVRPSVDWKPIDDDRIAIAAEDLSYAAELHDGAPFRGDDRVLKLALAGAAIAAHESNLAEKVVSCRYDGDPLRGWKAGRGRSITQYQLMKGLPWDGHTKAELCSNGALSAYVALKIFAMHGSKAFDAMGAFQGYASGSVGRRSKAAQRQCAMWTRGAKAAGLVVSCWTRLR